MTRANSITEPRTQAEPALALRVAHRVACTEAEGPHRRYALWTRGCTLGCPGCCNPELFDAEPGDALPLRALVTDIAASRRAHGIEGLTIVGGEPLQQLAAVTELAEQTQAIGLGVLLFSGYRVEEIRAMPGAARLLASVDTLVDGRFDARALEPPASAGGRRWIGSRNQRRIHRTPRYADPRLWSAAEGWDVELQLRTDGSIDTVGAPALAARLRRAIERADADV